MSLTIHKCLPQGDNKREAAILYCFAIVYLIIISILYYNPFYTDTETYYYAWLNIKNYKIDELRTPLYPIFIGAFKEIFKIYNLYTICIITTQNIIFFVSIIYYHKLTTNLIDRTRIRYLIVITYLICGAYWCNCILTESLSISFFTFLIYTIYKYLEQVYTRKNILYMSILVTFMLFLRPAFISLLPALMILIIFSLQRYPIKKNIPLIIALLFPCFLIFVYVGLYKTQFGYYGVSYVNVANQYEIIINKDKIIEYGQLESLISNRLGVDLIASNDSICNFDTLKSRYGIEGINNAEKEIIFQHLSPYLFGVYKRLIQYSGFPLIGQNFSNIHTLIENALPTIRLLYWSLVICGIYILQLSLNRQIPKYTLILYVMALCTFITTIIGAQQEWPRLIVTSITSIILIAGEILCNFRIIRLPYKTK